MSHEFFQNKECKYFPCKDVDELNCLFCFCPLYHMDDCGGTFDILGNGWKDCSRCYRTHGEDGYKFVIKKLKEHYGK